MVSQLPKMVVSGSTIGRNEKDVLESNAYQRGGSDEHGTECALIRLTEGGGDSLCNPEPPAPPLQPSSRLTSYDKDIKVCNESLLPRPLQIFKQHRRLASVNVRSDSTGTNFLCDSKKVSHHGHTSTQSAPASTLVGPNVAKSLAIPIRSSSTASSIATFDFRRGFGAADAGASCIDMNDFCEHRRQSMSDQGVGQGIHVRKQRRNDVVLTSIPVGGDNYFRNTVVSALNRYMASKAWSAMSSTSAETTSEQSHKSIDRVKPPSGVFPFNYAASIKDMIASNATTSAKHQGRHSQESESSEGNRSFSFVASAGISQKQKHIISGCPRPSRPLTFLLDQDSEDSKTATTSISSMTNVRHSSERSPGDVGNKWGVAPIIFRKDAIGRVSSGPELCLSDHIRQVSKSSSASSNQSLSGYSMDDPHLTRSTTLSMDSCDLISRSNFERTLAAFPRPPKPVKFLPTEFKTRRSKKQHSERSLRDEVPHERTILSVDIKLMPEAESLNTDGNQPVWVAVELAADIKLPSRSKWESNSRGNKLDVIICFDLSAATSAASIINSCEIAVLFVSMLDASRDCLGIVTTQTAQMSGTLLDLQQIKGEELCKSLAQIKAVAEHSKARGGCLETALKTAADLLSTSTSDKSCGNATLVADHTSDVRGHILLLSANVGARMLDTGGDLSVHVVNPAVVPWNRPQNYKRGWQLCSLLPSRLDSTALSRADDGLPRRLWRMIEHARRDLPCGQLRDLNVALVSGPTFQIESVLGKTFHATLGPGETVQLFVLLKSCTIARPDTPPNSAGRPQPASETTIRDTDYSATLANLDAMLGEAISPLLTLVITYKHSLLPSDTILTNSATSTIKRHTLNNPWSPPTSPVDSISGCPQERVQKHLAFYIATTHRPREALQVLEDIFGTNGEFSCCPSFLKRVQDELRYRVTITDGWRELFTATKTSMELEGDGFRIQRRDESEGTNRQAIDLPSHPGDKAAFTHPRLPPTPPIKLPEAKQPDRATQIWRSMRQTSRASSSQRPATSHGSENVPPELNGSTKEVVRREMESMKREALRNKRSLGGDTLRSVYVENQRGGEDKEAAPWL